MAADAREHRGRPIRRSNADGRRRRPDLRGLQPRARLAGGFPRDGVRVRSARDGEGGWEWSLQLERFGYEGALETVDKVAPVAEGNRVEYRRAELTEWYVNDPRGLEQGFTVAEAPSSAPGRALVLELRGSGLETRQDVAGKSILLAAADGASVLHYRGLIAWDAEGTDLPAEMWATEERIRIEVDDRGATYPLTIDPFIENAILQASDGQLADGFGVSLAVSGDTAVVGAWSEDGGPGDPLVDAGAAYVFERDQGGTDNWGEVKKLIASDAQGGDRFGFAVAISGDKVIVGARFEDGGSGDPISNAGAAYVFERDQGGADNWGEVKKLVASRRRGRRRFRVVRGDFGRHGDRRALQGGWRAREPDSLRGSSLHLRAQPGWGRKLGPSQEAHRVRRRGAGPFRILRCDLGKHGGRRPPTWRTAPLSARIPTPERPTSSNAIKEAPATGARSRSSRPPTRRRTTISAIPWRFRGTLRSSPRSMRTAARETRFRAPARRTFSSAIKGA